jgi:hypothetical protein
MASTGTVSVSAPSSIASADHDVHRQDEPLPRRVHEAFASST